MLNIRIKEISFFLSFFGGVLAFCAFANYALCINTDYIHILFRLFLLPFSYSLSKPKNGKEDEKKINPTRKYYHEHSGSASLRYRLRSSFCAFVNTHTGPSFLTHTAFERVCVDKINRKCNKNVTS